MKIDKSKLFKIAHAIYSEQTAKSFSEALKQAWKAIRVYSSMLVGKVKFQFRKVNGELRDAIGTLTDIDYTPKGNGPRKPGPADVIKFFDVEKMQFRSFKAANLI